MRFVIAIVLFVVAFVAIGFGIAQRTVLAGPDSFSTAVTTGDAPITVVDGAALNALPGTQTVSVTGQGDIFLAYGRTSDVLALDRRPVLQPRDLRTGRDRADAPRRSAAPHRSSRAPPRAAPPTPHADSDATDGHRGRQPERVHAATCPIPASSDLWVQEFDGTDELIRKINAPQDISLIIMSDGVDAAPAELEHRLAARQLGAAVRPADHRRHPVAARRSRRVPVGPRARSPSPRPAPQAAPSAEGAAAEAAEARSAAQGAPRRFLTCRRRERTAAIPPAPRQPRDPSRSSQQDGRVSGILTAGCCSPAARPDPACSARGSRRRRRPRAATSRPPTTSSRPPSPSSSSAGSSTRSPTRSTPPTRPRTRRSPPRASTAPRSPLRAANYTITTKDSSLAAGRRRSRRRRRGRAAAAERRVGAIGVRDRPADRHDARPGRDDARAGRAARELQGALPDHARARPRRCRRSRPPRSARSPSTPTTASGCCSRASSRRPTATSSSRARRPTTSTCSRPRATPCASTSASTRRQKRKARLPGRRAKIEFTNGANAEAPISFPTNDSGQIVAVALDDTETVTPTEAGAAINSPAAVKALSGIGRTHEGHHRDLRRAAAVLRAALSADASDAKIQLLGFSQGLIAAKEVN